MTDKTDNSIAGAMLDLLESMTPMLDSVVGYRSKCEAAGFSETVAEQMALQFHAYLISALVGQNVGHG